MNRIQLYQAFSNIVKKHCGILYQPNTYFQLDPRLDSLKKSFGCNNDAELLQLLQTHLPNDKLFIVIDVATNNETFFFRDQRLFELLEKSIFPQFVAKGRKKIDLWSLACSTGQEAYSTLISWNKVPQKMGVELQIEASDISKRVLQQTKDGIYTQLQVQRGLSIVDLTKYFSNHGESNWQAKPDLRKCINTSEFNLISSFYPANKYDIILCRNVLIYQDIEMRKKIINEIYGSLKPGGYLIMGSSENMLGMNTRFSSELKDGCSLYNKPDVSELVAA